MIKTPLLNNAEGKKRWTHITFTLSCMALATLCWIAFAGTKSFPDSEEIEVGVTQPGIVGADWKGDPYPLPVDPHGDLIDSYPIVTFGGTIQGGTDEYQTWKTTESGLTVYHGSNMWVEATTKSAKHKGIWFSPDFACALGAGTNTVMTAGGSEATVVEYILKNSDTCKPFLLLGVGAANNAKILQENGFKVNDKDPPKVTMALGSGINNQIAGHLANFCANPDYCGWRSPFDQNEIFICNKCMKPCLIATHEYYKVSYGALPKQMEVEYWFPNQKTITHVNDYVGGDGQKDSKKGQTAVQSGETLAFYAYAEEIQPNSESQENDDPNKKNEVPSKQKGPMVDKKQCTEKLSPAIMLNNDQLDSKKASSSGCKSESTWVFKPMEIGGLTPDDNIFKEDEDTDEQSTPAPKK